LLCQCISPYTATPCHEEITSATGLLSQWLKKVGMTVIVQEWMQQLGIKSYTPAPSSTFHVAKPIPATPAGSSAPAGTADSKKVRLEWRCVKGVCAQQQNLNMISAKQHFSQCETGEDFAMCCKATINQFFTYPLPYQQATIYREFTPTNPPFRSHPWLQIRRMWGRPAGLSQPPKLPPPARPPSTATRWRSRRPAGLPGKTSR